MSMLQASIQFIEFPDFIITWVQMKDIIMQGCSYMHVMLKYLCRISVWKFKYGCLFLSLAMLCYVCMVNWTIRQWLHLTVTLLEGSYLFWPSFFFWLLRLLLFCSGWWKGSSIRRCQHPYPWQQGTWRTLHRGNHWSLQGIPRDQMPWCWGEILDTLSLFSGNFRTMHVDRSVQIILVFI